MSSIRIFIIDGHAYFGYGLNALISGNANLTVIGESVWLEDAAVIVNQEPDLVMLDISSPGLEGTDLLKRIKKISPSTNVLGVALNDDGVHTLTAISMGIDGIISREAVKSEVFTAIKEVARGKIYFDSGLIAHAVSFYGQNKRKDHILETRTISQREAEIINLIAKGFTNQQISEQLFISTRTVESHKKNIIGKLGLKNTAELYLNIHKYVRVKDTDGREKEN